MFQFGDSSFPSLTTLVTQYQENPLYRKVKLCYPADDAFVESQKANIADYQAQESIYASSELYAEPSALMKEAAAAPAAATVSKLACKALYPYARALRYLLLLPHTPRENAPLVVVVLMSA